MGTNTNQDEVAAPLLRTSVQFPGWMWDRLGEIADRTFSSRAQVIRRLVGEGLEREPQQQPAEAVAS